MTPAIQSTSVVLSRDALTRIKKAIADAETFEEVAKLEQLLKSLSGGGTATPLPEAVMGSAGEGEGEMVPNVNDIPSRANFSRRQIRRCKYGNTPIRHPQEESTHAILTNHFQTLVDFQKHRELATTNFDYDKPNTQIKQTLEAAIHHITDKVMMHILGNRSSDEHLQHFLAAATRKNFSEYIRVITECGLEDYKDNADMIQAFLECDILNIKLTMEAESEARTVTARDWIMIWKTIFDYCEHHTAYLNMDIGNTKEYLTYQGVLAAAGQDLDGVPALPKMGNKIPAYETIQPLLHLRQTTLLPTQ